MPTFAATQKGYANLWAKAQIRDDAQAQITAAARKVLDGKAQYKAVEKATGVPWWWTGNTHMRESSCDFAGVLHNGEKIIGTDKKTTLVPAGRGPFATWEEAAIDALKLKDLDEITDWSIPRALYEWERFNGFGYYGKGVNSPYVWAGTTLQQPGKYVRDGVWDPSAVDKQPGCAALLKKLIEMGEVQVDEPEAPPFQLPDSPPPLQFPGMDMGQLLQRFLPLLPAIIMLVMSDNMPVEQRRALKTQLINQALVVLFGGTIPVSSSSPTTQPVAAPDFGNIFQLVGPIIGGLFGGPVGGAAGNVGGQIISSLLQGVFNQRR